MPESTQALRERIEAEHLAAEMVANGLAQYEGKDLVFSDGQREFLVEVKLFEVTGA